VGLILDFILKVDLLENLEEAFFYHHLELDFYQAFLPYLDFDQDLLIFPFKVELLFCLLENQSLRRRLRFSLLV
jgi:hypothetical protein